MGAANAAVTMQLFFKKRVFLSALGLALLLMLPASAQTNATAPGTNSQSAVPFEPAWISSRNMAPDAPSNQPGYSPLRSMVALLAIVGVLFGLQFYLRRRTTGVTSVTVNGPCVLSRRKLGMRQELLVVEWEKQQILLAVGPSFATRLADHRESACEHGSKESAV